MNLQSSKLEKAFSVLEEMKYYSKYFLEDERYITSAETVYLKFLIDDEPGANKAYLSIKKDERKYVTDPIDLTGYRIAVLVLASIHSDKEAVVKLLKNFDSLVASYGQEPSTRVKKEIETFNSAYRMVKKHKTDLDLPER
jgi:parvulin-like peptidyl-prolyl isomerase